VYTTKRTNTEKTNSDGGGQAMHEKSRDMQNERVMRMDKRNDQRKLQSRKPCSKATRHYKSRDAVEAKNNFFQHRSWKSNTVCSSRKKVALQVCMASLLPSSWAVLQRNSLTFGRPQGATVAPPAPVSGRGQREHRQHIGLCASLIWFKPPSVY